MRKLFLLVTLLTLATSCEKTGESGVGGSMPGNSVQETESESREELSSRRKLERDLKGRYSDKTVRRRYNLSKKQLDAVKKEMRKKDPSLSCETAQKQPAAGSPASGK